MTRSELNQNIERINKGLKSLNPVKNSEKIQKLNEQLMSYKKRLRTLDYKKWSKEDHKVIKVGDFDSLYKKHMNEFLVETLDLKVKPKKKLITLTAEFNSSISRTIEVDNNFNPYDCDLNELWYSKGGSSLSKDELINGISNLEMNEVWLVRNDKNEEIFVK